MDIPIWFSAASAAFLVFISVMLITHFTRLWRQTRDDPASRDEPWDPFG